MLLCNATCLHRESHIQKKIKAQLLDAKSKSQAKDKRGALFALKRKKMYEGELNKLNGARMTLESQVNACLWSVSVEFFCWLHLLCRFHRVGYKRLVILTTAILCHPACLAFTVMQIIALEGSNMNMQTFNAMRSGAKAMQDARGRLDVDQVDDVMDDIKDEMDIAEQVQQTYSFPS